MIVCKYIDESAFVTQFGHYQEALTTTFDRKCGRRGMISNMGVSIGETEAYICRISKIGRFS